MRIERIRVDGFGVLCDLELSPAAGLSLILGPNEAGKSTLLDFLRGALFGFGDRRSRATFHEPLRGGRHGGGLTLADDAGGRWHLERHVDAKVPALSDPDGAPADPAALARLLGHADEALFRSVFAFGLGELASFESLNRDEIREVVFSAGVLGAGRSATRALRAFEQRRLQLVRPRQDAAVANALANALEEVEDRLRRARLRAESYPAALAELGRLRAARDAARREAAALRDASRELERLADVWPTYRRRQEAAARLLALGELTPAQEALLAAEGDIRGLLDARSGHLAHEERFGELATQLQSDEELLGAIRERLGPVRVAPLDAEAAERVERLAKQVPEVRSSLAEAELSLAQAEANELAANAALRAAPPRSSEHDQAGLQKAIVGARQIEALLRDAEKASESAAMRRELAGGRRLTSEHSLAAALVLGSLLAATTAAMGMALTGRDGRLLAGLGALGLLVALCAAVGALRVRRPRPGEEEAEQAVVRRCLAEVERIAGDLGFEVPRSSGQVGALLTGLADDLDRRRRFDDLDRALAAAKDATAAVSRRVEEARAALVRIDDLASIEARALGFDGSLGIDGLRAAIETLDEAVKVTERVARLRRHVEHRRPELEAFRRTLEAVEGRVGLAIDDADVTVRVRRLESELEAARAARLERDELRHVVRAAEATLREALGTGEDAARLFAQLDDGAVTAWDARRAELAGLQRSAEEELEAAVGALRDAERAVEDIAATGEVAELELERNALAEELDAALGHWLELGAAKVLVEGSLARYERDRQPKVMALASELFAIATGGRYVQLRPYDEDEGRRRGIVAFDHRGARIDAAALSRGTAEQLYLCLRLAFAETVAEQSGVRLPIVADDVLVNFDPARAAAVAELFARVSATHQVLFFTCHPHVADLFAGVSAELTVLELPAPPLASTTREG